MSFHTSFAFPVVIYKGEAIEITALLKIIAVINVLTAVATLQELDANKIKIIWLIDSISSCSLCIPI